MKFSVFATILLLSLSSAAFAQAEQQWIDCGLFVYDSDGVAVDFVIGTGHVVDNKKRVNLTCHAFSENAMELFENAQLFYSACFIIGYVDLELDNLNVASPSGNVIFNCHIVK